MNDCGVVPLLTQVSSKVVPKDMNKEKFLDYNPKSIDNVQLTANNKAGAAIIPVLEAK